jgi:cytochrome c oxidase subunit IV
MTHEPAKHALDQADPHHEVHHEHVIVRVSTLVAVLTVLLVLTVITVGQAQGEGFMAAAFGVHLPQIFNVIVVMSIAVIKASLVALFFMQLRYDNPLNALVMLFSLFAVGLFLSFTMIDLGNRGIVDPIKAPEMQAGGLGIEVPGKVNTQNAAIVVSAREKRIEHIQERAAKGEITLGHRSAQEYYEEVEKPIFVHAAHTEHAEVLSSPNRTSPPRPVGPGLFVPPEQPAMGRDAHH